MAPYTAILGLNTEFSVSVYGAVMTFLYFVYGAFHSVYGTIYGVKTLYTEASNKAPYTAILSLITEFIVFFLKKINFNNLHKNQFMKTNKFP